MSASNYLDRYMLYNTDFIKKRENKTFSSARQLVPYLVDLLNPESVVDIGCANGIWLNVFEENGVSNLLGIDGNWIKDEDLYVRKSCFLRSDLSATFPEISGKYDLAVSIEVAEHLPEGRAKGFVNYLCSLSDTVAFSAAIPMQGGTGHINERPQSYWAEFFEENGYYCYDLIRPQFWKDSRVNVVHRQNLIIYSRKKNLPFASNTQNRCWDNHQFLDVVHPELYQLKISGLNNKATLNYQIKRKIVSFLKKLGLK